MLAVRMFSCYFLDRHYRIRGRTEIDALSLGDPVKRARIIGIICRSGSSRRSSVKSGNVRTY